MRKGGKRWVFDLFTRGERRKRNVVWGGSKKNMEIDQPSSIRPRKGFESGGKGGKTKIQRTQPLKQGSTDREGVNSR